MASLAAFRHPQRGARLSGRAFLDLDDQFIALFRRAPARTGDFGLVVDDKERAARCSTPRASVAAGARASTSTTVREPRVEVVEYERRSKFLKTPGCCGDGCASLGKSEAASTDALGTGGRLGKAIDFDEASAPGGSAEATTTPPRRSLSRRRREPIVRRCRPARGRKLDHAATSMPSPAGPRCRRRRTTRRCLAAHRSAARRASDPARSAGHHPPACSRSRAPPSAGPSRERAMPCSRRARCSEAVPSAT